MDPWLAGRWEVQAPGNTAIHGYALNRLYLPWCQLGPMVEASKATTPAALRAFYTSDLGEPFAPPGSSLSPDDLDRCRADYDLSDYAGEDCVMGIDVGLRLHVVIRQLPPHRDEQSTTPAEEADDRRLWSAGEVSTFEELEPLWERFHVRMTVIDAQPELHKAAEFARLHPDAVWLARYSAGVDGPRQEWGDDQRPNFYHVNRTMVLDELADRIWDGTLGLPRQARRLGGREKRGHGEYYRELLALQRTIDDDASDNPLGRWIKRGDDHYAHAEVYAMLAERLSEPPLPNFTIPLMPRINPWRI